MLNIKSHNGFSYSVIATAADEPEEQPDSAVNDTAEPDTTTNNTAQTPKANFQNLIKQQPNLVGNVLQDALKAIFVFTKLTDNEKEVALQTAGVVGGAVSSTIIPCLFDLTGPFTSVSDQNKFMRTALSEIRANIVTSHFPILLKQNFGGKNISGPDMQTLTDALPSAYLGVVGQLVQNSYNSYANNDYSYSVQVFNQQVYDTSGDN